MKTKITYYDILGIERDASIDDIKKAYKVMAKADHPDINGSNKSSNKRMALLNTAYVTLTDPTARREYDEQIDDIDHQGYTKVQDDENRYQGKSGIQKKGNWWTVTIIILIVLGYQIISQFNTSSSNTVKPVMPTISVNNSSSINNSFKYPTVTSDPIIDWAQMGNTYILHKRLVMTLITRGKQRQLKNHMEVIHAG